jgi:hypothetical protein
MNDIEAPDIAKLSLNKVQQVHFLQWWRQAVRKGYTIMGRATGKSFLIAMLMDMIIRTMPRSTWSIQGATYQQILTLTLPGTFEGLEVLGYRRDKHYFISKAPPKGYNLPYWVPLKYDNFITFLCPDGKNTVGFKLLSQDREGNARGPSFDGIIADESLTLDHQRFSREAKATNRGHDKYFKDKFIHHGEFHFSSMPFGNSGQWLLEPGAYYEQDGYDFARARNKIIDLQLEFLKEKELKKRMEIWKAILPLEAQMKIYPNKQGIMYAEGNAFDNFRNLGLRYILDLQEGLTEITFLIEVMNKHLKKIEESFYPTLDRDKHGYKGDFNYNHLDNLEFDFAKIKSLNSEQDKDCLENIPLHVGMDFGAAINWIVVAQKLDSVNKINFIKDFYVKSPKILDHVCEDYCKYYATHKRKELYFWPDPAGNNRKENSTVTPVEQACKVFKKHGWTVRVMNQAKKNIPHNDKFLLWAQILLGKYKHMPTVGFNLVNCKDTLVSMEQAPAIDDGGKAIRKNKKSEKKLKEKREEATDASDAADLILWGNYKHHLVYTRNLPFFGGPTG